METLNGLPVLRITIDEARSDHGVDKISLVDLPAIEENFLTFSKEENQVLEETFKFLSDEQMKLAGAFLIPDKPILRRDPKTNQEFYVVFPEEVIREIADRFNQNLYGNSFNEQHETDVKDVFVSENWIIEDSQKDKSSFKFGFSYPVGTWFGIVKVNNSDLWDNKIKTGELRGFSVELLAGLKFAIDSKLIEDHALKVMEEEQGLGEELPKGAILISESDISDNENDFNLDEVDLEQLEKDHGLEFRVTADPQANSSLDRLKIGKDGTPVGQWLVRYKYDGVRDDKNRSFCARVLDYQLRTGRVFRKEDVDQMSFRGENREFGIYSIFTYKGSYGCRHKWKRLIFFVDFEDKETRAVGNVPGVTSSINDSEARKKNAKPTRSNLSKTDNKMSELKTKFETIEELTPEQRVLDAQVDNEDGTYTVEGVTYQVTEGRITEIMEETPEAPETPEATETPETPEAPDSDEWKMEVMNKIAELEAKIEQIMNAMNGTDSTSSEQFSKVELEEVLSKFMSELKPAENKNDQKSDPSSKEKTADKVESVIVTLSKMRSKK
jgi:hypothetical protein